MRSPGCSEAIGRSPSTVAMGVSADAHTDSVSHVTRSPVVMHEPPRQMPQLQGSPADPSHGLPLHENVSLSGFGIGAASGGVGSPLIKMLSTQTCPGAHVPPSCPHAKG